MRAVIEQTEEGGLDLGSVCHICPCGSQFWNIQATFENYEISFYLLDMRCAVCGNKAIAPTPVDCPEQ